MLLRKCNIAWFIVFLLTGLCVAEGWSQEGRHQADIVRPTPGEALFLNGEIEVRLKGLTPQAADSLLVQVLAYPAASSEQEKRPLCLYQGSSFVPVEQDLPVRLVWVDKTAGEATLLVKWNYVPPGFDEGEYLVKVELFVQIEKRLLIRWGETEWNNLRLVPKPAKRLKAELISPKTGDQFGLGQTIVIQGQIINGTPPAEVSLQVLDPERAQWYTVVQARLSLNTFTLTWDTSQPIAGRAVKQGDYHVRVQVIDAAGELGYSDEVIVELVYLPSIQILVRGEAVPRAEARVGEEIQFGFHSEREWASYQWDFGDKEVSCEKWPLHKYRKPGTYKVCLTAWSGANFQGVSGQSCVEIEVRERIPVFIWREIYGYPLPNNDTKAIMPGFKIRIRLNVKVNEPIIGLSVTEEAPPGWKVENCSILDDSTLEIMTLASDDSSRLTWVLTTREQRIAEGTEISLVYALSAPTTAELGFINLSGTIYVQLLDKAEGPIPVKGQSEIKVVSGLPVCVAIAYLEKAEPGGGFKLRAPDVDDDYQIDPEQIEIAKELIGQEVPHTGGKHMTPELYLQLRACYVGKIPVTNCNCDLDQ